MKDEALDIALRVYPIPKKTRREEKRREVWMEERSDAMLVFDTETRTDPTQRLTFGSYRFIVAGKCLEEGIFYADDLPQVDLEILKHYVATNAADTAREGVAELKLLTRAQFADRLFTAAYKGRCLLVGFNVPFDLSRIAIGVGSARGWFAGGFSFPIWTYVDAAGTVRENPNRPRVAIKHIDSKCAFKGFSGRAVPDTVDLIPEGSATGESDPTYFFRGHILDLRTLAFALTNGSYTLASACKEFGVEHGKMEVQEHGVVTEQYIDYNRRDVLATAELAEKLLEEYDRHPIDLQVTKAYSPASIGKAYLKTMGVAPILQRQPSFPKRYLGNAQSAFYGGRTSAHIRKVAVPIVNVDFLSMYTTVNGLMGLWRFFTAAEIEVVTDCKSEIEAILGSVSAEMLFHPEVWPNLTAFVRIIPDGDILPTRANYGESNDWQIGLNFLHARSDEPNDALWYALPDVVVSVLLTGRIPKIVDAFRLKPVGSLPGLSPAMLRGAITVDPYRQDFFRVVIEERKRHGKVDARLDKFLKVLASATSYGIFAQMDRQESLKNVSLTCYGIDADPYPCRVRNPEDPGAYCFPPVAALITAAARLMLALLERCVGDLGGAYAMEDTDSMAIVATRHGGLIECLGGTFRKRGNDAIRALTWEQVRAIADRFAQLNPYDRAAIPGSILKIEDDNFDPKTKRQRQVWCLAISAKRYALFLRDPRGEPAVLRKGVNNGVDHYSQHGLGHLLNPSDPESEDHGWIAQAWLAMIRRSLGFPTSALDFETLAAVGATTVSSPAVLSALRDFNAGKTYPDQVKPFNFISSCHVRPLGHPMDANPARFHLIAQYERDPRRWEQLTWIDQYAGKSYRISTSAPPGSRTVVRVKSYSDVLREYEYHPEAKCADSTGKPCNKQSVGLLGRRHVVIGLIKYIGKESNRMEEVNEQSLTDPTDVYVQYPDPRRDEWMMKILPKLKAMSMRKLMELSGMSRAALQAVRAGRKPHPKNALRLEALLPEDLSRLG